MEFEDLLIQVNNLSAGQLKKLQTVMDERAFDLGISRYSLGKIYGIRHKETNQLAYIGSTIKSLKARWGGHLSFFKTNLNSKWTLFVNDKGGPNKFSIELIEKYSCKDNASLLNRERFYIRQLHPVCNIMMTGETQQKASSCSTCRTGNSIQRLRMKYDDVEDLTTQEFTLINDLKSRNKHSRQQASAFDKYVLKKACFHRVSLADTKILFDDMQMNPTHRLWLSNLFRFMVSDDVNHEIGVNLSHCVVGAVSYDVQHHMDGICQLLGLQNIHDISSTFNRKDIEDNIEALNSHLKALRLLLKKQQKKADFRSVTDTLRTIFKELYGIKLENLQTGKRQADRQKSAVFSLKFMDSFAERLYTCGLL